MSRMDELDIVISRKNGKVIAAIPQLKLYAKGDNTESAMAALDEKKKRFVADLEDAGALEELDLGPPPAYSTGSVRHNEGFGRFALKTGIVACAVVAVIIISSSYIAFNVNNSINNAVDNVKSIRIGGRQFWTHVEDELDRMANPDSDLPEAKKQKLLADIRIIGARWHPFLGAFQSALANPNSSTTPSHAEGTK